MNTATANRDATRLSRSDRQAQLFDFAMTLFARDGYDAVTVEEICAIGKIGRATFFRLFGGKSGLIEEANRRTADRVRRTVEERGVRGAEALLVMSQVISGAWLSAGAPIYSMFETIMGHAPTGLSPQTADAAREGSIALADLAIRFVSEGQTDGALRSDLDPEAMGLSFMSLLLTACSIWVRRDERDPALFPLRVEQAVSVMITGLTGGA